MNKVFLVAGGSGGHLFPALSVLDQLNDYETLILTDQRTEQYLKKLGVKYRKIITAKIQINLFLIFNLIKLFFSILDNIAIILKRKPDIIIGFGGYSSIPTLVAAKILKKKIIIHEQNAVMGKTNRILSKIADIVAITFPKTKFAPNNAIYTGIPLRKKKKITNFKTKKKRIFIVGGSQGAKVFSTIIPESTSELPVFNLTNASSIVITSDTVLTTSPLTSKFPVSVRLVNCGLSPVPKPSDVLAVDPLSNTYCEPFETIKDPSAWVKFDKVVRSASKACTFVPIARPIPVLKAPNDP